MHIIYMLALECAPSPTVDSQMASIGSREELVKLINHLAATSTRCGMKISPAKTKLTTNSKEQVKPGIAVSGQEEETVSHFKYLGTIKIQDSVRKG